MMDPQKNLMDDEIEEAMSFISRKLSVFDASDSIKKDFLLDVYKALMDIAKAQKRIDFSIESRRESWRRYKQEQRAKTQSKP